MNPPIPRDLAWFHDGEAESFRTGKLWSLWDMLT